MAARVEYGRGEFLIRASQVGKTPWLLPERVYERRTGALSESTRPMSSFSLDDMGLGNALKPVGRYDGGARGHFAAAIVRLNF